MDDKKFAVHFPWIDKIFGTYYCVFGLQPRTDFSLALVTCRLEMKGP